MEKKIIEIYNLYDEVDDLLVRKFFDLESEKLLDEKIEVLTKLKNGVPPGEIDEYYLVLERLPPEGEIWD